MNREGRGEWCRYGSTDERDAVRRGLASVLALALCTVAPSAPSQAKETPSMSTSTSHGDRHAGTVTASQAMLGVLDLIRQNKPVAGITPESMGKALGLPITRVSDEQYGYAQRLPDGWSFSVQRKLVGSIGPRVDLVFAPVGEGDPSPSSICSPDFAHFTAELDRMGFARQTSRGEHDRWIFDAFDRPGQHVEVYPLVTPGKDDAGDRTCVKMVLIR